MENRLNEKVMALSMKLEAMRSISVDLILIEEELENNFGFEHDEISGKSKSSMLTYSRSMLVGCAIKSGIHICHIADYMNRTDSTIQHYKLLHESLMKNNKVYAGDFERFTY